MIRSIFFMKKIIIYFLYYIFFTLNTSAQFTKYIVRFKDKSGTPFTINNPSEYLSQRAIERRTKQNIAIDETDLPITPRYIDSVRLSGNVSILDQSKWLNQVCIQTTDATCLGKNQSLPFVIASQPLKIPVVHTNAIGQ